MAPASKAAQKAVAKYVKEKYDRVVLTMPKGKRDALKTAAQAQGESLNGFVTTAIDERMARLDVDQGGDTAE